MVMRIKFIRELPEKNGFKSLSEDIFSPQLNDATYTITVGTDGFLQVYLGSSEIAYGRQEFLVELIRSGYIEFS